MLVVKNQPAKAEDIRDTDPIPRSGRCPGEGNGNPFQYSYLENSADREDWRATVHGVKESATTEQESMHNSYLHEFSLFLKVLFRSAKRTNFLIKDFWMFS